jgi:hypothetical protein
MDLEPVYGARQPARGGHLGKRFETHPDPLHHTAAPRRAASSSFGELRLVGRVVIL